MRDCYLNIAVSNNKLENNEKSLKWLIKTMKLTIKLNGFDSLNLINIFYLISKIYFEGNNLDKALFILDNA